MEKLKLSDLDKYVLLHRANHCIWSRMDEINGGNHYPFISPLDCHAVQFRCGAFSKKHGALVEVIYKYYNCRVILTWHYVLKKFQDVFYEDFIFIPKVITIEREFKSSILISILPNPSVDNTFIYQSNKSLFQLCVEDSDGEDEVDVRAGACPAEVDDDSTNSNYIQHFDNA